MKEVLQEIDYLIRKVFSTIFIFILWNGSVTTLVFPPLSTCEGGRDDRNCQFSRKVEIQTVSKDIWWKKENKIYNEDHNYSREKDLECWLFRFLSWALCFWEKKHLLKHSLKQISNLTSIICFNSCVFWECRCLDLLGTEESCSSECSFYHDPPCRRSTVNETTTSKQRLTKN